jgi:hypothetical protein
VGVQKCILIGNSGRTSYLDVTGVERKIKIDLKGIGCKVEGWIYAYRDRTQLSVLLLFS